MIPSRYRNAYKEVYIILSYLDEDDYNKVPLEVINAIENNMNEEYEYYMNEDIDLSNQQMLPETKATLFNLFRDYLSTPEQKGKITRMQREDRLKFERQKGQKYGQNVFENKKVKEKTINELEKTTLPTEVKKSLFGKIIDFFRNLFKF